MVARLRNPNVKWKELDLSPKATSARTMTDLKTKLDEEMKAHFDKRLQDIHSDLSDLEKDTQREVLESGLAGKTLATGTMEHLEDIVFESFSR